MSLPCCRMQDALAALAPCAPSILVLDEFCMRFAALAQQLTSLRHIIILGVLDSAIRILNSAHSQSACTSGLHVPIYRPKNATTYMQGMRTTLLQRCRVPCQDSS